MKPSVDAYAETFWLGSAAGNGASLELSKNSQVSALRKSFNKFLHKMVPSFVICGATSGKYLLLWFALGVSSPSVSYANRGPDNVARYLLLAKSAAQK